MTRTCDDTKVVVSHREQQLAIRTLEAETDDVRSMPTAPQVIDGNWKAGITHGGRGMRGGDSFARELR